MEKGLKNLQGAHRRFLRRERDGDDSAENLDTTGKEPLPPDSAVCHEEDGLDDSGLGRSDPSADSSLVDAVDRLTTATPFTTAESYQAGQRQGNHGHRLSIASMLSPLSPPANGA